MKKAEIEPKLAEIMDTISECEGIIAIDGKGKVVAGQTLTDLDQGELARSAQEIVQGTQGLGELIKKGGTVEITITYNEGFAQVTVADSGMIIGLLGSDGRNSISLLMMNMKNALK